MSSQKNSLAKNSLYNVLYRILNIIFPFITSIYVARVLKADGIGKVAAAQNIVSYFTIFASMGIPTYGIKLIAQFKVKSKESSQAFIELFIINFLLSMVCSIAYYILIFTVPYFDGRHLLYSITGFSLILNIINVDWFYQGIQEYRYIALRSLVIKVVALGALVLLVKKQQDYIIYALITSAALGGNYFFNIFKLPNYIQLSLKNIKLSPHLKPIVSLFIACLAAEIYVLADTTMLDVMTNSTIVGYYSMSMKIVKIIRGLVVAVSAVFLPQLSYYYYNGEYEKFKKLTNRGLHILLVLSLPVALGIMLVSDDAIITFFGNSYIGSILTTKILSLSVISVAISNYIGLQILVILGKEKITTISTICGAVLNIIFNYILIPIYLHEGAAIASTLTEIVVMVIQILLARKYIRFSFKLKTVLIPTIIMCIGVGLIHQISIIISIRLIVECLIGMLLYYYTALKMKDEFVLDINKVITKKVRR